MNDVPTKNKGGNDLRKQSINTFIAVLIAVVLISFIGKPLDDTSKTYLDKNLKRVLAAYVASRAVNAAVSFFQELSLSVSPLGVGVGVKPGEILDPINDMVERFSQLLLVAAASLTIMNILFFALSGKIFYIILAVLCALVAATFIRVPGGFIHANDLKRYLLKAIWIILLIRIGLPGISFGIHHFSQSLLMDKYNQAVISMDEMKNNLDLQKQIAEGDVVVKKTPDEKGSTAEKKQTGIMNKLLDWGLPEQLTETAEKAKTYLAYLDMGKVFEGIYQKTENFINALIMLSAVFVLETIIMPLFFLWLLFFFTKRLWVFKADG